MVCVAGVAGVAVLCELGTGCEVHLTIHNGRAGIRLRSVPALSRSKEADMENQNNRGGGTASKQSIRDADLQGRQLTGSCRSHLTHQGTVRGRFVINRVRSEFANAGSEGLAIVLEEIAARCAAEAEVLRGR